MIEELAQALRTEETATALALIAQMRAAGADLNAADALGWPPVLWAAQYGKAEAITALHAAAANLNAAAPDGRTPAHLAAEYGHAGTITALHAADPNLAVNAVDLRGWTPAHLAAQHGHAGTITALRAAVANLNATGPEGWTPVHVAAQNGHAGTITALHAAGANLNATGPDGWTPAHVASRIGHAEALYALHEAGANLNTRDVHGQTPTDVFGALFLSSQRRLMTAVVEALGGSADTSARNLASDLKCPVMLEAYTASGETRPVRLPDGPVNVGTGRPVPGSVLSAFAASHCLRPEVDGDLGRPPPTDPLNRNRFTEIDAEAYLASDTFLLGDAARVALVGAVWEACRLTDETPAAIAAAATTAAAAVAAPAAPVAAPAVAAGAAVPQYQAILDASAARSAPGPRGGAAGPRRDQGGPAM